MSLLFVHAKDEKGQRVRLHLKEQKLDSKNQRFQHTCSLRISRCQRFTITTNRSSDLANAFSFDEKPLAQLLDDHGLQKTWSSLLKTHVTEQPDSMQYILENKFFEGAKLLEKNSLSGLSIGQIGVLYEFSVAYLDRAERKTHGQFFTPDDVAGFMVKQATEFPKGKWLDPCSGIGNLAWHLVNAMPNKEKFLVDSLVLSDRDSLALQIARVLFSISFQDKNPNLYNDIESNFVVFDFLSVADDGGAHLFSHSSIHEIPAHDFVIVNPPYRSISKQDPRFETAKAKDLYAYFLENILKTSEGFVSITPQSFTNAGKFSTLRSLMLEKYPDVKIYSFDNIPGNIFHGVKYGSENSNKANSIRVAITVAKQGQKRHRVTSLLRWKTSERSDMFDHVDDFLTDLELTDEYFPKVSSIFKDLHDEIEALPPLGRLISSAPTEFVLFVPSAPRYFISALKMSVSRASMKTLYFRTEHDLNLAYLVLNSSFMYWWWRVRDGGMTLSLETIKSLPMPNFAVNRALVLELEESEKANKVFKKNAGSVQENVKHPQALLKQLNKAIVPNCWEKISSIHQNSDLQQLKYLA